MTRLFILIAIIGGAIAGAMQLSAQSGPSGWQTYDEGEFVMAQAKGKTIVVDIYGDGCPACRAQAPIMEELRAEKQTGDVLFVKVNFADEKAFLGEHRIPRQSTILVFNGKVEAMRAIAETNRSHLRQNVLNAI